MTNDKSTTTIDQSLILSSVRALWGCIMPSLVSVSIEIQDHTILWQCIFDPSAAETDLELLSSAAAEVIADFKTYNLKEIIKKVSYPNNIEHLKNLIYLRYEVNK